jgi:antitoxin component YwqK of YwqJK toxin-antitoxin module
MRNGVKHGNEYRFHPNGKLLEKKTYCNGRPHGIGKQWAEDGRLLVTWKLVNGSGLDLWCDYEGRLAEEHYWPKPGERGYARQWNSDERTVYAEYFYRAGIGYHGIWRKWNRLGRMMRGFPRFFVCDRKVTKNEYFKICKADSTLPPYLTSDDDPHRVLPEEYLRQRQ